MCENLGNNGSGLSPGSFRLCLGQIGDEMKYRRAGEIPNSKIERKYFLITGSEHSYDHGPIEWAEIAIPSVDGPGGDLQLPDAAAAAWPVASMV